MLSLISAFISIIGVPLAIIAIIAAAAVLVVGTVAFGGYAHKQKKKNEAAAKKEAENKPAEPEKKAEEIKEEPKAEEKKEEVKEEPKAEEQPKEEEVVEVNAEPEDEVPEDEKEDVNEILAEADSVEVAERIIDKKFVYEHIENAVYADKVELNKRENYNSANWPVADTHYALGTEKQCFIYVYETKSPTVLIIYNTPEYAAELKKDHPLVSESKVPRSNTPWYKLIMDNTYTEEQVGKIIDDCFEYAYVIKEEEPEEVEEEKPVVEEPVQEEEEQEEEVTLKASLAAAATVIVSSSDKIDKKFVYEYLENKYGEDVETNKRENFTSTGLPLADTHYALGEKKKCFVYVYETNGTTLLLINNTAPYGKELKKDHSLVTRSAFPKSKDKWFSLIIDDSYSAAQVCKILDDCYILAGGKPREEEVAMTLKESLAAAAKVHVEQIKIDKKYIAEYLEKKYADKVEINTRENKTSTGLPLADTQYAVNGKKKKCFVYVYEADTSTLLLINSTSAYEKELKKTHKYVSKSAFPKSKDEWFSVVVDDSFTNADIDKIMDDCYELALK